MKEKISVISVLYYSEHLISPLVKNIKFYLGRYLDKIILINNSKDDLSHIKINKVQIYQMKKNLGYGAAINFAFNKIDSHFMLIMNPDNFITKFEINLNELKENIYTGIRNNNFFYDKFPSMPHDTLKYLSFKTFGVFKNQINYLKPRIQVNQNESNIIDWVYGDFMLMSVKVFKEIKGFDENFFLFYEETDFCRRALDKNIKSISLDRIYYETCNFKSSIRNVDLIKIRSEIESFKYYHLKYSNYFVFLFCAHLLKIFFTLGFILTYFLKFLFKPLIKPNNIFLTRLNSLNNKL
jgi:GT2 family glycosyltransferase